MAYNKYELERIRKLQLRVDFDVYDYLDSKADELFERLDTDPLSELLRKQMNVKIIDGEKLNDFIVELVESQAIIELENELDERDSLKVDLAS